MKRSLALLAGCCFCLAAPAQTSLVRTEHPPMGWNSWDAYGLRITEAQFRANVAVLRDKLKPFGYNYAVIDEGWFFFNPEDREKPDTLRYALDANGRYVPVPERFPSAVVDHNIYPGGTPPAVEHHFQHDVTLERTSFKPLADWVHAQGLKFGIHIVRGIPRASVERNLPIAGSTFRAQDAADTADPCPWDPTNWGVRDTPAGQAWYDSLLAQYAAWGVDLLKVDCIADHPYQITEIRMIRRAIDKAGRPMILSLSPGPTNPSHAPEVSALATMWRISDDIWDLWDNKPGFPQSIKSQFARAAQWAALSLPPGTYPDLDMLPLGDLEPSPGWGPPRPTRLTPDEQRTLLTLWALNRSPLILGANLTTLDPATMQALTNRDVLDIDQHATRTHELLSNGDLAIWRADLPRDHFALALFNRGNTPIPADQALTAIPKDKPTTHQLALVDLWTHQPIGKQTQIPPHGCLLLESR